MPYTIGYNAAEYHPRRINMYVPAMRYHADCEKGGIYRITFGTPALAAAAAILGSTDIGANGSTNTFVSDTSPDPYGRNVTVTGSSGTDTGAATIRGRDYLGQPMIETIVAGDAAATAGVKAFKWIDSISWVADATETMTVGWGAKLGLPFKTIKVLSEESDAGVATLGTLVTPSVAVQSATTTDPRGMYTPNTTPDGAKTITITALADNSVNSAGDGGLHGLRHYYA